MKRQSRTFPACLPALALSAAAALVAGCSSGNSLGDVDRVFLSAAGSWDRDRDGVITCDEWRAYAGELFDGADANRDGFVERTEYSKIVNTDRMFATVDLTYFDANGDQKLDRNEFVTKPNRAFVLLGKESECRLTADQVAGARAHTEQVFDSKKPESGDPREKKIPGINQ
jgi:hypothetical protein